MKFLIATTVIAFLNFSSLTAQEIELEPGAQLTLWVSGPLELGYYRQAAADFVKLHPGLAVNLEDVPAVDARSRLETRGPAGTGADLFITPHDQLGDLTASGLIMPNLVYSEARKQEFLPATLPVLTFGGNLMAFPVSMETLVMFYNKNLFPAAPSHLDELITKGLTLTEPSRGRYGFLFPLDDFYVCFPFLSAYGGYVFGHGGKDPRDLGIARPEMVRGLETMLRLKSVSMANAGDATWDTVQGLFMQGKAGAILQGPWALKELSKAPFPLGIAALPRIDNRRPSTFSGIMVLAVSTYSKYPRAAQSFASFLTTEPVLRKHFTVTGQIPPLKNFLSDRVLTQDPQVSPFLEQLENSVPMPNLKEMKYLWIPMRGALTEAWNGKETPVKALEKALASIRNQMGL